MTIDGIIFNKTYMKLRFGQRFQIRPTNMFAQEENKITNPEERLVQDKGSQSGPRIRQVSRVIHNIAKQIKTTVLTDTW